MATKISPCGREMVVANAEQPADPAPFEIQHLLLGGRERWTEDTLYVHEQLEQGQVHPHVGGGVKPVVGAPGVVDAPDPGVEPL